MADEPVLREHERPRRLCVSDIRRESATADRCSRSIQTADERRPVHGHDDGRPGREAGGGTLPPAPGAVSSVPGPVSRRDSCQRRSLDWPEGGGFLHPEIQIDGLPLRVRGVFLSAIASRPTRFVPFAGELAILVAGFSAPTDWPLLDRSSLAGYLDFVFVFLWNGDQSREGDP